MQGVQEDEDEEDKVQEIVRLKSGKKPTSSSTEVSSAASKKKNVNVKGSLDLQFFKKEKNLKKLSNWKKNNRQTSINDACQKDGRARTIQYIARFFYRNRDPFNVVRSNSKLLQGRRTKLFWMSCSAHCLDLMLEDIGKIAKVKKVIQRGIMLVGYIYYHPLALNTIRKFTNKSELVRDGVTRFVGTFLMLQRLHKQKDPKGKKAIDIVLMPSFWNDVAYTLKAMGPTVHVLRLVDNEKRPAMGYIYEVMDRVKEAIQKVFNGNEDKYKDIFAIIDRRWDFQLHHPLHVAVRKRTTMAPAEWWKMYRTHTPHLRNLVIKVLSLTCSLSGYESNWSTFEHENGKRVVEEEDEDESSQDEGEEEYNYSSNGSDEDNDMKLQEDEEDYQ
ncbi:hypothetical protein CR513_55501, partial [Mucuna pruriens]